MSKTEIKSNLKIGYQVLGTNVVCKKIEELKAVRQSEVIFTIKDGEDSSYIIAEVISCGYESVFTVGNRVIIHKHHPIIPWEGKEAYLLDSSEVIAVYRFITN